ncbi:MAG: hypothetical protein RIB45_04760 [Marivibrio sp.]|uniref:hypothetical protein n=1 Tax=Marivibrio sp. TaxID=2039719 RepID=UPI0032ECB134
MQTSQKIGSFTVDPDERILFAGTMGGDVLAVDIDSFEIVARRHVHAGAIEAIAAHPRLPYVAAMSMDRSVSLMTRPGAGDPTPEPPTLTQLDRFTFRDTPCRNDTFAASPTHSLSQALTFHPTDRRLATRSGSGGVLELDFDADRFALRHCTRFHGDIDLVTVRYTEDGDALISAAGGHAVLSRDGEELRSWTLGDFNLHWFEPLGDDEYLIACDELYVIRLDIQDRKPPLRGLRLTRDDLEHVTYNSTSKRAFVAGFDGTVYEINPESCDYARIAWVAPYKMRWVKTLERDPNVLIGHCFNGGLYKVDLASQRVLDCIKETPNTVWTSVRAGDSLFFAGEGGLVREVALDGVEPVAKAAKVALRPALEKRGADASSFTKRMAMGPSGLILAEKNGRVLEVGEHGVRQLVDIGQELRDIAVNPDKTAAFVCTERGEVRKLRTEDGKIVAVYHDRLREPIWSLAYHETRNLLAFAERRGNLVIADGESLDVLHVARKTSRPKRMKWWNDTLIYVRTGELWRFDLESRAMRPYVADCGNTIEDFIWDASERYLVLVNYRTEVVLCDFKSGEKLCVTPDQADFSKGLAWLDLPGRADAYPLDFVTFGRSGTAHRYRIHNERLTALGPIAPALL